jgi:hypothetical protein
MENAGSFVVETLEQDRSVYRLYHQLLAEYLRQGNNARDVQQAFVTALLSVVPTADSGRDWFNAHPYIRTHLAEHAVVAGVLPSLMADPIFLLAADCTRLLGAINASTVPLPTKLVQAYKAASIHIRTKQSSIAASYLELAVRQSNATLEGTIRLDSPWSVPWAQWSPPASNNVIAVGDSDVTALDTGHWTQGETVAVVGRENGDVEVWDLTSNSRLAAWHSTGTVKRVALANTAEGPLVAAVRSDSTLSVHHSSTGQTKTVETGSGYEDYITAMIVAERDGNWICITAHYNLRLVIWSLPDLNPLKERIKSTGGAIYALCIVDYQSQKALLSGGDHLNRYNDNSDDSTLRLWSLDDLTLLWKDGRALDKGYVTRVSHATFYNRSLAIVTGILKREIWDLNQTQIVYDNPVSSDELSLYSHNGRVLLLAREHFATITVFEVERQEMTHQIILKPNSQILNVSGGCLTNIVRSQKRDVILTSTRDHVRIWDLDELLSGTKSPLKPAAEQVQCLGLIPEQAICVGSNDQLILRDMASGAEITGLPLPRIGQEFDSPTSIIFRHELDSVFIGTHYGKILRVDAAHPSHYTELIVTKQRIKRLQVVRWQGRTIALTTGFSKGSFSARVWDLQAGEELFIDRRFRLSHGQEDKTLYGLAVAELDGDIRFAFAGQYGKIMVANFAARPKHFSFSDFDEWYLPFSSSAYTMCLESGREEERYLLAAGTEYGHIALWDFLTGEVLAEKRDAHRGYVNALAMHERNRQMLILSAGNDGFLRVSNTDLEEIAGIEVGESINAIIWLNDFRVAVGTARGLLVVAFSRDSFRGHL